MSTLCFLHNLGRPCKDRGFYLRIIMEWIKVKVSHILIEYPDFSPQLIGAWIVAMGLTAVLEKMPTELQLKKHIHGSTLNSLKSGLSSHGVTLEFVLSKVLDDVEYAISLKETNRSKIAKWRENKKKVTSNVPSTEPDKIREDKTREDMCTETQIKNLLTQFPLRVKTLMDEYLEIAEAENKSGKIIPKKRLRLISEIYNVYLSAPDKDKFYKALEISVTNQAPNVNYIKKVIKSDINKKNVYLHNKTVSEQEGAKRGNEKAKRDIKQTQEYIKSIQVEPGRNNGLDEGEFKRVEPRGHKRLLPPVEEAADV